MLPFFITLPLAAAFLVSLAGRFHRRVVEIMPSVICLILSYMACVIAYRVSAAGGSITYKLGGFAPGIGVSLVADGLSAYILVIANFISLAVASYSIGYMRSYTDTWKYYTLLMIMVAGVNGVILTGDIFNMFVFLEIASITMYALVAFGNEDGALEASFKYAVMGSVASSLMLLGIAFLYNYSSTLNLTEISAAVSSKTGVAAVKLASALFFVGLAFKAALAPFHAWMPDAYSNAPATIPAMSSGVLVKALGVYALARLFFNVFGVDKWVSLILVTLAVLSMVLGSLLAFGQSNVKRLLGFSSISQIGYIFLGLGIGTPLSITAAVLHIFNHSVAKSLLFINAGEMEKSCPGPDGKIPQAVDVRPAVRLSSLAGVLSICGVPPFAGFWSKLLIIISCLQARRPGLAFIAALVSMLTIAYYFKAYAPFVSGRAAPVTDKGRIPAGSVALTNSILFVLAMAALLGGLLLLPGYGKLLVSQASSVLINGVGHIAPIMGSLK